jgi:hypothetical protein
VSVRTKYHLLVFVAIPAGLFGLLCLGMELQSMVFLLAFPYLILLSLLGQLLRCPNCHERIGWQTFTVLGFEVRLTSPYIRRECDSCGHDLSRRG